MPWDWDYYKRIIQKERSGSHTEFKTKEESATCVRVEKEGANINREGYAYAVFNLCGSCELR